MNDILILAYEYLRALWRRRWIAALVAWAVCLIGWAVVLVLPEKFMANARVYVDARTALRPTLEGIAIQQDFAGQLALVREALLSRPQLEAVARKTNLDAGVNGPADMDKLIAKLQSEIIIDASEPGRQEGSQQRNALFTIWYMHTDRDKSIEVVRTLLDSFVEGTLSGNRSGANEAQSFLVREIQDLEKRLAESEARLAEFKKRNVGMLPGDRGDYFSRLETELAALQQAETNLAIATSRRDELRRQLTSVHQYVPGTGSPTATTGAGVPLDVSMRIQESEARLEELLQRFTDKHPEVIALRRTIEELKQREKEELENLAKGGPGTGAIRSLNVNPVYQSIQLQINQAEVELASLRGAVAQHRSEIEKLRRHVDSAPEVEQEFARLNRDYDVLKEQYETLVARLEQARVTDNAAQSGIVRFEVIEPPQASLIPVWPKRKRMVVAILVVGIGAGIAFALLPHILRPTFDSADALARIASRPVLGTVSALRKPNDDVRFRREIQQLAGAGVALVGLCAVLVVFGNTTARLISNLFA
jgi:polysaccharide chain length determinant protein (PEP-CTERM system associated)